jgi:tetratricopeptide (TPR) repeat protein
MRIFPDLPSKSSIEAITSFGNTILARFYLIAGQSDKYEKLLNEAIKSYKNNSLAITQLSYLKMDKEPHKTEKNFKIAFNLIQNQFNGIQRLKNKIQYDISLGLAYIYYRKERYEEAERKYNDALELHLAGGWYDWWFGKDASKLKKAIGIAMVVLTGIVVAKANYAITVEPCLQFLPLISLLFYYQFSAS